MEQINNYTIHLNEKMETAELLIITSEDTIKNEAMKSDN